ncbi:Crp/Fnr family transcriptional regulator [Piscinibacter sakaiensis]|uniref:Crp/Fnr family transcriptional regulator n=1 Tax=Piscinibacter sakaiensis TaxID=1547922 RepID=UPI003AAA7E35
MQAGQIEMLQRMPVFGGIRAEVLGLLLDHAAHRRLPAGQAFFREGEPGDRMFVLEAGRAAVVKGWQGSEVLLHHLEAGDCFGEMALMDLFPRSASVIAETDCVAIELTTESLAGLFERDLEQFALIQMNIGREVCRRLRAADDRLFRLRMGEAD